MEGTPSSAIRKPSSSSRKALQLESNSEALVRLTVLVELVGGTGQQLLQTIEGAGHIARAAWSRGAIDDEDYGNSCWSL